MVSSMLCALLAVTLSSQTECSILYFKSTNCAPCREMEPALVRLTQQGWQIQTIDAPNELDLARQFQVRNLPTVVIMAENREVDRVVGVASYDQLNSRISRVAARYQASNHQPQPKQSPASSTSASHTLQPTTPLGFNSHPNAPAKNQPNQPIVRGQSPGSNAMEMAPGQAYPMLASVDRSQSLGNQLPESQPQQLGRSRSSLNAVPGDRQHRHVDPVSSSTLSIERAISRAADATVRIKVEESNSLAHGTGTIVAVHGGEALVLTCGHLFRDMLPGSRLTVDLFAGTPRQVNVIAELIDFKADKEDIALLTLKLPVPIEPVPMAPRADRLQPGQKVFSFGCDHGNNPTRRDTQISRVNRYLGADNLEIDGAPAVGRSGGGLFDTQGRLVGVCNAACQEDNEGIYAAGEVIYKQMARVGYGHLFDSTSTASASTEPVRSSPSQAATQLVGLSPDATKMTWPDEDQRLAVSSAAATPANLVGSTSLTREQTDSGHGLSSARGLESELNPGNKGNSQLVCVLRDTNGQQQVVTIDQPSQDLLRAIQQQAAK